MATKLGVYFAPGHMRTSDFEYIRMLNPAAVRVLEADAEKMKRVREVAPGALLFPRIWEISEDSDTFKSKQKMEVDPIGLGVEHAQYWDKRFSLWTSQGYSPDRNTNIVVGINEPRMWTDPAIDRNVHWNTWYAETLKRYKVVGDYTVSFLNKCREYGLRACALNLSVGWPPNLHDGEPSYWAPWDNTVRPAIVVGRHFLMLHEYWYRTGPADHWGWWAGRFAHNHWPDVQIVIGECGIENQVDLNRMRAEGLPKGWNGSVSSAEYARQLTQYRVSLEQDQRVVAMFPFLTDYYNREWQSQDTAGAHADILWNNTNYNPAPLALRPNGDKPVTEPPVEPTVNPLKLIYPIADGKNRITQYFAENPANYAQFGLRGHNGLDIGCPTGTRVFAIADGEVMFVDTDPAYGNYLRIYHPTHNICSFYAHLRGAHVAVGQRVKQGDWIADSGNTGNSTGPHLHLETRKMVSKYEYAKYGHGYGAKGQIDPFAVLEVFS